MTEWWTYRPSDFLMFSPRVYARLIEVVNESLWPAPWIGAGAAVALLVMLVRRDGRGARTSLRLLAFAWGSVALLFHARHFASINTAAPVFAWAFGLQALLLLALTGGLREIAWRDASGWRRRLSLGLMGSAAAFPLLAPVLGRPWAQAECFGLLPDPTVLATLALLPALRLPRGVARVAWTMPLLWCVVAVLLQWTLHEVANG